MPGIQLGAAAGGGGASAIGASVYRAAALLHPTTGADVAIAWDTEVFDDGNLWVVGSPTRLTVPAGEGGLYQASAIFTFASHATGDRWGFLRVNNIRVGTTPYRLPAAGQASLGISLGLKLSAGDYVEVFGGQACGGSLGYSPGSENMKFSLIKA